MNDLESTLYLLLLRIIHGQYEDAFEIMDRCYFDGTPKYALEVSFSVIFYWSKLIFDLNYLWEQFKVIKNSRHPDAYACRLKLHLLTLSGEFPAVTNLQDDLVGCIN